MNFNLQPQFTASGLQAQQFVETMEATQTSYTAPICTVSLLFPFKKMQLYLISRKTRAVFVEPTGHTFGHSNNQSQSFQNQQETHFVFYHHHHHDYYYPPQYQQYQQSDQPIIQEQEQHQQQQVQSWVPPDPFTVEFQNEPNAEEPKIESTIVDMVTDFEMGGSPVQPKEQILEEIVRECEEIERRSLSGGSPLSSVWSSSDERDTPDLSYRPYKTPEKKERKKAQNRLAATRYREKKRREKEVAMECIDGLAAKNSELKEKVTDLSREVGYLKKLMKEVGVSSSS